MTHEILTSSCHHLQKESIDEEQEQWVLHQKVVGLAEPEQERVGALQLLDPQLARVKHCGEIPERATLCRGFNPVGITHGFLIYSAVCKYVDNNTYPFCLGFKLKHIGCKRCNI